MMVFLFRTLRARHICIVIRLKIFRRSWLTQSPGKFFLTRQRWLNSDNASNATSIQWYISLETTLIDGIFAWKRGYLVKKGNSWSNAWNKELCTNKVQKLYLPLVPLCHSYFHSLSECCHKSKRCASAPQDHPRNATKRHHLCTCANQVNFHTWSRWYSAFCCFPWIPRHLKESTKIKKSNVYCTGNGHCKLWYLKSYLPSLSKKTNWPVFASNDFQK